MTILYKIVDLEKNVETGIVTTVHWSAEIQDDKLYASTYGAVNLSYDESSANFIPFEELTESVVVSWIQQLIDVQNVEQTLLDKIEQLKTPQRTSGLPWKTN